MTKILIIILFFFAFNSIYAQGIQFEEHLSWQQIQEKARKENKFIFIDVYATWCAPCKQMDAKVYSDEQVGRKLNEKFISIKVQQDQTKADNEHLKSWYTDARAINEEYKVEALPCFLFLSPEGKLVHRDLGFHDVPEFIQMVEMALTDPIARFHKQLTAYKKGIRNYGTMPDLIKHTKEIEKDEQLVAIMAKDYKENYLNKLSEEELLNKEHLNFIGDYFTLINTKDKFFNLCYQQPAKVDKIKNYVGWANFQVTATITREEVDPKLWKNSQPLTDTPNWREVYYIIKKKYPKVDAKKIILDAQIDFYGRIKSFRKFAKYRDMQIKLYPPKAGAGLQSDSWGLNVHAWLLFENSNDKEVLKKALAWSELSIKLDEKGCFLQGEAPNIQLYDTKANLLYKLGRIEEAIAWEKKAIKQGIVNAQKRGEKKGDFFDEFNATVTKMERGEPTWPTK